VNLRLGVNALVGSDTEAAGSVYNMLVAVAAPTSSVAAGILSGTYWTASLEFLNGAGASKRETLFPMTSNGAGAFGTPTVTGEATTLGDTQIKQSLAAVAYTIAADGTGSVTFPIPSGGDPTQQLIAGAKAIYAAQDGSFFFGGGTVAGGQGMVIGIKAATNATASLLTGLYAGADMRVSDPDPLVGFSSSYAGTANALGDGRIVWSRRFVQSTFVEDVTTLTPYTLNPDASGSLIDNNIAVGANGQTLLGSGLSATDTKRFELFFAIRAPSVPGSGLSLNPQGVFNVFSFAPSGNPIAPGEFITIYGTGLPPAKAVAPPFPNSLGGAQLMINNTAAPLFTITATQVFAVVPYSIKGPTATIVFMNNGTPSNTITVPVADSAPGVAAVAQNGLGAGAITHANGSLVSVDSPASRGETIVIYLTGLGQVTPAVKDGAGSTGLSNTNSVLAVYVNGTCGDSGNGCDASNILYQGLTPGYPGLYQINVTIPKNTEPGSAVPLAIQTASGFTDLVDIAVQ